ncbi:MAG: glycosyltransferase family 39 protein [bacterium]
MKWLLRHAEVILVPLILIIGIGARTYHLTTPLGDWHSWRQADTAAVARNFIKDGWNPLYPQSDSLLALNDYGLENPNRYFINEFPLYNSIVAGAYHFLGVNHVYGRVVSIVFVSLGTLALYGLTRLLLGPATALIALAFYQFNPYNIYYSRVVMPDPSFAAFSIIALYFCVRWVSSARLRDALLMAVSFAVATLLKPYAVFMLIPIIYWIYTHPAAHTKNLSTLFKLGLVSFVPLLLWRYHVSQHPEGSFATTWLYNADNIRFKGAFFRWLVYERLNRLIFATGGFALFVSGYLLSHLKKNASLFFVWTSAIFLYMTVFAKGNVNHDYYQLPIVAPGSVLIAYASLYFINLSKNYFHKIINGCLVIALIVLSFALGWYEVRGYFNINNGAMVQAGIVIDQLAPPDALVIAPYQGDPAFLYQTNRHGWPIGGQIDSKILSGASYYVTTSFDDEFSELKKRYGTVIQNNDYAIIKLTQ